MLDANIISLFWHTALVYPDTKSPYSHAFPGHQHRPSFLASAAFLWNSFDVHGCKHWHIHYKLFILPFLTISSEYSKAKGDTNSCQDDFTEVK